MTTGFTDHHCHLLPSLDDGATDLQESVEMARILAAFGFGTVHCTPHRIKGCYENDPERVVRATGTLQRILDDAGISLRLVPGTEHYLDEFLLGQIPGALATPSRQLLVEAPFGSGDGMVTAVAQGLQERGLTPLFAHPERSRVFDPVPREEGLGGALSRLVGRKKEPDLEGALVSTLRRAGSRFQGNLGSFAGDYGSEARERAILFLRHGIYACLGSDAHRSDGLAARLSAGFQVVASEVGEEAARRLLAGSGLES